LKYAFQISQKARLSQCMQMLTISVCHLTCTYISLLRLTLIVLF